MMNTTMKAKNRILSFGMAVCLLLTMVLYLPGPMEVYALPSGSVGDANDGINFDALVGNGFYYGTYKHETRYGTESSPTPILWQVMEEAGSSNLTLLSEYVLCNEVFRNDGTQSNANLWEHSDLRTLLNSTFITDSFNNGETDALQDTTVITNTYEWNTTQHVTGSTQTTSDKIYIPWGTYNSGSHEHRNKVWWNSDDGSGTIPTDYTVDPKTATYKGGGNNVRYCLRSPVSVYSFDALYVDTDGSVYGDYVYYSLGVRPAFQLNPSSIIFTSEIKSTASEDWETQADDINYFTGEAGRENFKLTVVSSGVTLDTLTGTNGPLSGGGEELPLPSGGQIDLTGTFTNADNLVYKIVDRNTGKIVSYGVGTGNSLTITDDANMIGGTLSDTGDYTLYVWAQKNSTDYHSDEGSQPLYFTLEVESDTPTVQTISPDDGDTDVPVSGNIEITFDKTMDTNEGTVSLNNGIGTLTGDWTVGDTVYTIAYADLDYDKDYTITLTGFQDTDGNLLDPDPATYTFHTIPQGPHVIPDSLTIEVDADDTFTVYLGTGPDAATSANIASDDPGIATVDISYVDTDDTEITVTGVAEGPANITITWNGGPQDNTTETVSVTVTAVGTNPPSPKPAVPPTATPTNLPLDLDENTTGTVTLSLGMSGDSFPLATGATATSDNENAATVPYGPHDGEVTITAVGAGTAIITFTFDDPDETQAKVTVNVTDSDSGPGDGDGDGDGGEGNGDNNNGGSSGGSTTGGSSRSGRDRSSGGSAYTPPPKTQLPASAFSWDGQRTLTIDHDSITPLGLMSVQWDGGAALTRGADYSVYTGSVIVRFSEAFMAEQKDGDHTVRVEFLNHTGEITVTVGDAGLTGDAILPDNDTHNPNTGGYPDGSYPGTHNPNTGGYPDGSYPGTDNPNTGDGCGVWPALLLGSVGVAVLVRMKRRTA